MNTLKLVKEEENTPNVTPFKVLLGGKGEDTNWLSKLTPGTIFLSRPKSLKLNERSIKFDEWHVVSHSKKATCLFSNLNDEVYAHVDTAYFSQVMELSEILTEGTEDEVE